MLSPGLEVLKIPSEKNITQLLGCDYFLSQQVQEWTAASLIPFLDPPTSSESLSLTSLPLTHKGALHPLPSLGAARELMGVQLLLVP